MELLNQSYIQSNFWKGVKSNHLAKTVTITGQEVFQEPHPSTQVLLTCL